MTGTGRSQAEKAEAFQKLHYGEPFVIPNPWDAGSAQELAKLGFKALASTSGGFARTMGQSDGEVSRDEVVAHAKVLQALPTYRCCGAQSPSAAGASRSRRTAGRHTHS